MWLARDPDSWKRRDNSGTGAPARVDLTLAEEHGELMPPVFGRGSPPPYAVERLTEHVEKGVVPFSGPDDFVILAGPTAMVVVLATVLITQHGRVGLLVFNSQSGKYEPRRVQRSRNSGPRQTT